MPLKNTLFFFLMLFSVAYSTVKAETLSPFELHKDKTIPSIAADPILELYVTLKDKVHLGRTDSGERAIVPITGGYFRGDGIQGDVVTGGADWQHIRSDGVKEYVARYSIRTDDGKVIMIDNRGIGRSGDDGQYRFTVPRFHAPEGKYEWLNRSLFVGTITSIKRPRAVVIRVYRVE